MVTDGRNATTEEIGPEHPCFGRPLPPRLVTLTRLQQAGLIGFLFVSAVDVILSALLFFGGGGGYIEANPVLAWASGGLSLFLVAVLAVKAIGAGVIALLVSFANRFCTLAGDAVVLAALCTTTALFLLELVTVGAAPALLTIDIMIPFV